MKSQNHKFDVYTDFYHGCGIDRKWPLDMCALVHFYKLYQGENSFSLAEAQDSKTASGFVSTWMDQNFLFHWKQTTHSNEVAAIKSFCFSLYPQTAFLQYDVCEKEKHVQ